MANSPVPCSRLPIHYHAPALLSLFGRQDIIWIGRDLSDTGRPAHKWRFREAAKWIGRGGAPGVYVCPSTFHPLSYSRSVRNVKERRFLVVESDVLTRDEVGSVFQWMRAEHYRLRAVVDTAGKSLHGWFDFPAEIQLPRLKTDLIELGCDPAMFGASQPCRLPGALRNGRFQKLLYIDA